MQKNWSSSTIISIGRRYVQATYANKDHRSRAIRLCEDICYNLRRVWGALDPKTLEMSELLSQLYTSMGHYREAMGVHEHVLRLVVEGDDGDDRTIDTMESNRVKMHVEWLKQSYLRLQGWDKSEATYRDLVDAILHMEEYRHRPEWQGVRGVEHWDHKKEHASDSIGTFVIPKEWEFEEDPDKANDSKHAGGGDGASQTSVSSSSSPYKRSGMGMKRATSNWGLNHFRHAWNSGGDDDDDEHQHRYQKHQSHSNKPAAIFDGDEDGYESAKEEVNANGNGKVKTFAHGVTA